MKESTRRLRFTWYSILIVLSLAVTAVLVVSEAQTNDQSEITGQPAGVKPPAPLVSPTTTPLATPVDHIDSETAAPDEAHWQNGDLIAPLPNDPARRRQALDQAFANASARPTTGGVAHTVGGPASGGTPDGSRSTEDPLPNITPYIPLEVRAGKMTWNLKLPDQFVADPDVLRGIDPTTGAPLAVQVQEAALVEALTPDPTKYWDGIGQTNLRPPDPDVAAGPNHVVAVVNARFAFYDKCGNNLFESNFATYVGDAVNFYFDPKVIYDTFSDRWIMTVCWSSPPIVRCPTTLQTPGGGFCRFTPLCSRRFSR